MSIPKKLQPHIDAAFPAHYMYMATVLANGYPQVSPRGSVQVYDDNHLSTWERGTGNTDADIRDGAAVTFVYSNPELREQGMFFVRLYGKATVHKSGPVYDKVFDRLIEAEKGKDPDKKGFAILVEIEKVEDLMRKPLTD
jgi:predicted pyridoxine 5'-phosphate oxidase superfamily flavin-nucleotide-binding protein